MIFVTVARFAGLRMKALPSTIALTTASEVFARSLRNARVVTSALLTKGTPKLLKIAEIGRSFAFDLTGDRRVHQGRVDAAGQDRLGACRFVADGDEGDPVAFLVQVEMLQHQERRDMGRAAEAADADGFAFEFLGLLDLGLGPDVVSQFVVDAQNQHAIGAAAHRASPPGLRR